MIRPGFQQGDIAFQSLVSLNHRMASETRPWVLLGILMLCVTLSKSDSHGGTLDTLVRQVMNERFYVEEQARSAGHSGIKSVRNEDIGTRSYYSGTFSGNAMASIHNHGDYPRTVGMGEIQAVLNGVEFRTRHNDYGLRMKCQNCTEYGATDDIPLPGVPPEVTQYTEVDDQIKEMRQWFKDFKNQDHSKRDYRKYFKPVLCYLEGTWTESDPSTLDEPFFSDRHALDANSFLELQDRVSFTSYSGSKNNLENYAYLPTRIMGLTNDTTPIYAQWNYKILCHPLKRDVPLGLMRAVNDLSTRLRFGLTYDELQTSRGTRYQFNLVDEVMNSPWRESGGQYSLLDSLMMEIPGADNYVGDLKDTAFDLEARSFMDKAKPINTAFYHRKFKVPRNDAMGRDGRTRGFNDPTLYMAMTSQDKVVGMDLKYCNSCSTVNQKWTYAIPLELIYLTPLHSWNPYNFEYKGDHPQYVDYELDGTTYQAFDGISNENFYQTPADFFDDEFDNDPADTTQNEVYVRAPDGEFYRTRASGVRVFLPNIQGVGAVRQRYPIMPVYEEGAAVWKELEALKDLMMTDVETLKGNVEELKENQGNTNSSRKRALDMSLLVLMLVSALGLS